MAAVLSRALTDEIRFGLHRFAVGFEDLIIDGDDWDEAREKWMSLPQSKEELEERQTLKDLKDEYEELCKIGLSEAFEELENCQLMSSEFNGAYQRYLIASIAWRDRSRSSLLPFGTLSRIAECDPCHFLGVEAECDAKKEFLRLLKLSGNQGFRELGLGLPSQRCTNSLRTETCSSPATANPNKR